MRRLGAGEIDAALLRPPVPAAGMGFFRVASEQLLAAVPEAHPLAAKDTLTLDDSSRLPLIMYDPYQARYFHDLVAELFSGAGFLPRPVQHLTQVHSILALVPLGAGARACAGGGAEPPCDGRDAAPRCGARPRDR